MKLRQRIILSALILISAALCWFAASLQAGYTDSPGGTRDSNGHPLGFLNPVTWELCVIMLRNATLLTTLEVLGWYGAMFLLAHFAALIVFAIDLVARARRVVAIAFWLQLLIFPTGWLSLLFILPHVILIFFAGRIDGEAISDIPFWWTFQPLWLAVSFLSGALILRQDVSPEQNANGNPILQPSASPRLRGS